MTVSLTHSTVAVGTDNGNGEIHKAEWNAEHAITMATAKVLGRATAGTGAVEEIAVTGSGSVVLATSPALTTPNLGTPTALTLTSATGLPVSGIVASTSTAIGVGSVELGHATDTTIARVSAGVVSIEGSNILVSGGALGTPASGTLTNATGLPVAGITASTSTALGVGSIELGHASDTTLSRSSAGVLAVEGVTVSLNSTSAVHTASTIELGAASDTTLSRASAGVLAVEGVNVLLNGGALGTPSSGTLTNATGLPAVGGGTGQSTYAKGDILASPGSNTLNKLAVGTDGFVFTADAASTNGVKWAAAAAGGSGMSPFGDGSDGDVTVSGSTTLTRDMYYHNLTLSGSAAIDMAGWRIFVSGTLDISAAPAGAIHANGTAGNNASGATGGSSSGSNSSHTVDNASATTAGANGQSNATTAGSAANTAANGGTGGAGGASGAGATSAGAAVATSVPVPLGVTLNFPIGQRQASAATFSVVGAGTKGSKGAAGGGSNSTQSGGGSGATGGAGGTLAIVANIIARGTNSTAAIIQAKGGAAGTSGNGEAGGNCGGGAGSGGGGGGWALIVYGSLTGSTITNAIDVSGGAGGLGGNGTGGGTGGTGGGSGYSGMVALWPIASGATITLPIAGSSGTTNSGATGGAGATINTKRVDL